MDRPPEKLERWTKGQRVAAVKLNQPLDALDRLVGGVTPPAQKVNSSPRKETRSQMDRPPIILERWAPGQKVEARKLNQPLDAIERIRGGVRPPRQITKRVIAAASRFTSAPLVDSTYIDADNPTSNFYSTTGPFTAYSTTHGSFSTKKRIVMRLAEGIEATSIGTFMAVLSGFTTLNLAITDVATAPGSMQIALRVIAIQSDFDPTTLTWNDWAGLSKSTGGYIQIPASVSISGALNPGSQTITKSLNIQFNGGVNDKPSLALHGSWSGTLYGVGLEVAPFNNGSGSPSSIAATATMTPSLDTNPTVFEGYRSGIIVNPDAL